MIAGRFKLVIFDCDGVLVDSEPIINRAHAEVLTVCGFPITEEVHQAGRAPRLSAFDRKEPPGLTPLGV
jgi:beta-phosphoglucomutase-like phosphatase (HAD superfamily)